MTDDLRTIDQVRACRIALGILDQDVNAIDAALTEARNEGRTEQVLLCAARSLVHLSAKSQGVELTRQMFDLAIQDADIDPPINPEDN